MPEIDNDFLDDWLGQPVRPMQPPPGTFERVRKRARRRKVTRAAGSAAAVAAVLVIAIAIPRAIAPQFGPSHNTASATTRSGPAAPARSPAPTTVPAVSPSAVSPGSPPPVPPDFAVSSVTFVGQLTGWVLGQAGTPGQCTGPSPAICTSIARTDTAGRTWYGVPAPVAGGPSAAGGVSQLRFADASDGWAFGPGLWATHDAGANLPGGAPGSGWTRIRTGGMRVLSLEAVNGRAFSIWARCPGHGGGFAAGCRGFTLYSAAAGQNVWAPVPGGRFASSATGSAAELVLTGTAGYLMTPAGRLLSGPVNGGPWHTVSHNGSPAVLPCASGPPQASGLPSQALLAATGPKGLLLACPGVSGSSSLFNALYYSQDGGAVWQARGNVPGKGTATSVSGSVTGAVVVATTSGIEVAGGPGDSWTQASGASSPGGFTYVGMTLANQGVAVAASGSGHELWFTFSAAQRWVPSALP